VLPPDSSTIVFRQRCRRGVPNRNPTVRNYAKVILPTRLDDEVLITLTQRMLHKAKTLEKMGYIRATKIGESPGYRDHGGMAKNRNGELFMGPGLSGAPSERVLSTSKLDKSYNGAVRAPRPTPYVHKIKFKPVAGTNAKGARTNKKNQPDARGRRNPERDQ